MPNNNSAAAHAKLCCPNSNASMIAGFASAAAPHQPRPSSGNATKVPTKQPTVPSAVQSVTAQLPNSGHTSAAVVQLRNP